MIEAKIEKPEFKPISIVLTTQKDVDLLYSLMTHWCVEQFLEGRDCQAYDVLEAASKADYSENFKKILEKGYGK